MNEIQELKNKYKKYVKEMNEKSIKFLEEELEMQYHNVECYTLWNGEVKDDYRQEHKEAVEKLDTIKYLIDLIKHS